MKRIYAGGNEGWVYEMDVRTGKVLRRWIASPSGRPEYGHRITTISVSPDGRFVAAGTGPTGLAFVFSTQTGKRVRLLNHGGSTILESSFSPDSKYLATFVPGSIRIWAMPQPGKPPEGAKAGKGQPE